jgi:hypothetical protein
MQNQAAPNPGANQGTAKVKFGVLDNSIPTSHGLNIGAIKDNYTSQWNMPSDVEARVNGKPVGNDHVLGPNEVLEFHRRSGEKG